MSLHCPQCGKAANPNAKFCSACGASLAAAPQIQRLRAGQEIGGHYRILRTLGKGGMGLVYLAQNKQAFDRQCVVKEMLDYFDRTDPKEAASAKQRFEDEGRTLSRLNHPGIPGILAYFSEASHNYIVMDFVEGKNLEDLLGANLPDSEIIRYGIQVCEILEYLAGLKPPVVHHDIKPANIIVDASANRACLVDFGTAKARLSAQPGGNVGLQKSSIYGTQGYAPPEQYKGLSEPRSDVYALAATLYHLATNDDPGEHPFTFPQLDMLAPKLRDALAPCLREVQRRSTAQALRSALQDALKAATRTTTAQRKSATLVSALGPHESYAVVSRAAPPAALRGQVVQVLQSQLSLTAVAAEVLTWQVPACYLRQADAKQAQALAAQLKALSIHVDLVQTSQLHSWRSNLGAAELQRLSSMNEVTIHHLAFPQDRVCVCHGCGHKWNTQAQELSRLRATCSKCGSAWYVHRIFRCSVCGHEFAHADTAQKATALFAKCPGCQASAWRADQLPRLVNPAPKISERLPAGATKVHELALAVSPPGAALQGRATFAANWLTTTPAIAGGKVAIAINSAGLQPRQSYKADGWLITNAGSAQLAIEVYVEAPPQLAVDVTALDFGVVKAQETRSLTVAIRNAGDLELTGTITSSSSWLQVSKTALRNRETVVCQVTGSYLYQPGVNTATLLVESNGGNQAIPVTATALPTTLEVTPAVIDLGHRPRRGVAQATVSIVNSGLGLLEGEITADAPWLKLSHTTFVYNATDLKLTIALTELEPGATAASRLTIKSNGGACEIPVQVLVSRHGWLGHLLRYNHLAQFLLVLLVAGGSFLSWLQVGRLQQAGFLDAGGAGRAGVQASAAPDAKRPAAQGAGAADAADAEAGAVSHVTLLPFVAGPSSVTSTVTTSGTEAPTIIAPAGAAPAAAATLVSAAGTDVPTSVAASTAAAGEARVSPTRRPANSAAAAVAAEPPTASTPAPAPGRPTSTPAPPAAALATPTPALPTAARTPALEQEEADAPAGAKAALAAPLLPAACLDPNAMITEPANGATLNGIVRIIGAAAHPQFRYYKLEYASADTPDRFSYLTGDEVQVTGNTLAEFDTTRLKNGDYLLRLTVVDDSGNYPPPCGVSITIFN